MSSAPVCCLGAIAVELRAGQPAGHAVVDRETAGQLAALLARDLAAFAPAVTGLDVGLVAGFFDPVELLRPGWPLHAELERLCASAPPAGNARVIAFGADNGALPAHVQPQAEFQSGPLRVMPWLLRGQPEAIADVGARLEADLLETGMAAADTALLIQQAFASPVEHVRYLTLHDLAAMMAMQYEHAGLAPVWPLLETALLAPNQDAWLDAPPEPLARYHAGEVRLALLDFDAWVDSGFVPAGTDAGKLSRAFERFEMRQRQIAALLAAHGLAVRYDHCPAGRDPRASVSD